MSVVIDWCDRKAAEYAVLHWHYSKAMPVGKLSHVGIWENEQFIGTIVFGRGASDAIGKPYGLQQTQVCELVRVAMRPHATPVSQCLARALKMLVKLAPELRLVVSYADTNQGHAGIIYQASNWVYSGFIKSSPMFQDKAGRVWHSRQVSKNGAKVQYGTLRSTVKTSDCVQIPMPPKHKYLYPLDAAMRQQIEPLRKPYPKRADIINGDLPDVQSGEGGSIPTSALELHITQKGANNGA